MAITAVMSLFLGVFVSADFEKDGKYWVETINKTFKVEKNGTCYLKTDEGSVKVLASSDSDVHVKIFKKADADSAKEAVEAFEGFDFTLQQKGNDVWVELDVDDDDNDTHVSYELMIPENYNISLKTGGGSISVADMTGNVNASTGGGSIKVGNVTGEVKTNTGGGSVTVGDVKNGMVHVNTGGGSITLSNVEKDVKANTGGGSISVKEIGGVAAVNTGGGSIKIGPTTGKVVANTGGGSIRIEKSGGDVKANTGGGSIAVNGSKGSVKINTGGGSLSIVEAMGYLAANTGGGSIKANFLGFESAEKKGVTLKTGGGSIDLGIPSDIKATIKITINLDDKDAKEIKFKNDFNLKTTVKGDEIIVEQDINGGGPTIELETTDSDVMVRKL